MTRKREYYYGEDRGNVYELAHLLIDYGAGVVLSHEPHMVRAIALCKNIVIAYSLGNFLTYGRFNLRSSAGEAPLLELQTNATGRFFEGQIYTFRQGYDLDPRNDARLSAIKQFNDYLWRAFWIVLYIIVLYIIDDLGRITYFED